MSARASCPLCGAGTPDLFHAEGAVLYFECRVCTLVYLDPERWPARPDEEARYREHHNDPDDAGYIRFLRRLADPVMERLPAGARGLDFGCGPVPALASLLASAGFPCVSYDPVFAPDELMLNRTYDFVTCSEVLEHLHDPRATLALLARLLARGGMLAVMTQFRTDAASFAHWWYRRDITHVCFHSETTMRWIAADRGWALELPRPGIALFTVAASPAE